MNENILDAPESSHKSNKYYRRSDKYFRYAMYILLLDIILFWFIFPVIKTPISPTIYNAIYLITYLFVVICTSLTIFFGVKSFIRQEKGSLNRIMILLISFGILLFCLSILFLPSFSY